MLQKTLVAALTLVAVTPLAAFGQANISLPDVVGDLGEMVTFDIEITDAPNTISSFGLNVGFDNTILSFTGSSAGDLTSGFVLLDANAVGNTVIVGGITTGTPIPVGANGVLVSLHFTVLACPVDELILTLGNFTDDLNTGEWVAENGSFMCPVLNVCPVASPVNAATEFETAVVITFDGADADGDPLTFGIVSGPSNGTLGTVVGDQVTYTPNAGFFGMDSFTYMVDDGQDHTGGCPDDTATVTITVNPAPIVAEDGMVTTDEDTAVVITLVASGGTGALTFAIESGPSNGSLGAVAGNQVTYTPNADFFGADSFTFTATDGETTSDPATVSITVNPVNDPPVAFNDSVTTDEDTPVDITLMAADVDDDDASLTFAIVSGPSNGSLGAVVGNQVTYTPNADFFGMDSFTFTAEDPDGAVSNVATVSITVNPVNDPPVAFNDSVTTDEDTPVDITLVAADVDDDDASLTFAIVSGPSNGSLGAVVGNQVTYTPNAGFFGMDSFTFTAEDPQGAVSNVATVSITVTEIPEIPVPVDQEVDTDQNTPVDITLMVNPPGADVTFFIVGGPSDGMLSEIQNGNMVTYTPDENFTGEDSFTYGLFENVVPVKGLVVETATVTITVNPVINPPVAVDLDVETNQNTPVLITLMGHTGTMQFEPMFEVSTQNGGVRGVRSGMSAMLTFEIATGPSNGSLSAIVGDTVTYTPNQDYTGPDSFTYTASDGMLVSDPATVSITVLPVNQPPMADAGADQNVGVGEKVTLDGSGSFDPDGDMITYAWTFDAVPGGSALTDSDIEMADQVMACFTPDVAGMYVVQLVVNDGELDSAPDFVQITAMGPENICPNADAGTDQNACLGDEVFLDGSGSFDSDGGPEPLTFAWSFVTVPAGSVLSDGDITNADSAMASFTPDVEGAYVLQLTVFDGECPDTDEVTITVAENAAPNADAGPDVFVVLGETAVLDGTGSHDPDDMPEPLTFSWTFVSVAPGSGLGNADILDADTATPSVTPDVTGFFVLQLEVSDGKDSDFDNVTVIVGEFIKTEVDHLVEVVTENSRSELDAVTRIITTTKDIRITNTSNTVICLPAWVVVPVSADGVSQPNATEIDGDGNAVYNLAGLLTDDCLDPGESVMFVLEFNYHFTVNFTFSVEVCGSIAVFPEPVAE